MKYQPVPALGKDFLTPLFDTVLEVIGLGTPLREQVLEQVHIQNDERVLDVGCGTAALLLRAKARVPGASLIGIDADPHILGLARKKIHKQGMEVEVRQARAEDLPFPSASFDVVVSTLTFHHLPTPIKHQAIAEIHRVLRPSGRFLLADFGKPEGIFLKVLFALGTWLQPNEARYFQDNRAGKLPLFLEEAGFTVQEQPPRYRGVQFLLAHPQVAL
jgi:ubiquinone/menaquinone biosynthesis C-methylase UbiE